MGGHSCVVRRLGDSATRTVSWLAVECVKEKHLNRATMAIALDDEAKVQGISIPVVEQDVDVQSYQASRVPYGVDQSDGLRDGARCPREFNSLGRGVDIWIIDTGCRQSAGGVCASYIGGRRLNSCSDINGHGTHVGGTATDATYGVAPGARRNCIGTLDELGRGRASDTIAAILYVQRNRRGKDIINLSLGGGRSTALNNAVRDVANSGVYFAIASGNDRRDSCLASPASAAEGGRPRIFSVAAHDQSFRAASFSNAGACTTISAPGVSITSTAVGGGTITFSGTSMACPHVAGAMAVLLSNNIVPTVNSLTASTPPGSSRIRFTFSTSSGRGSSQHPFLAYECARS